MVVHSRSILMTKAIVVTLLFCGVVVFAHDGTYYWHDVRFLYTTSEFPMQDILSGEFNPHQLGEEIDVSSASGFYAAKVFHLWLLKALFQKMPASTGGLEMASRISLLLLVAMILIGSALFAYLFREKEPAYWGLTALLMMPITPYLAGKLLSELTAGVLITLSVFALAVATQREERSGFLLAGISGLLLFSGAAARLDMVVTFIGFLLALLISGHDRRKREWIFTCGIIASTVGLLAYLGTMKVLGICPEAFLRYFWTFTATADRPELMSVVGILSFGGIIYGFGVIGLFSDRRRMVRLFATWAFFSAGCMAVVTSRYMIEPRYLFPAMLPFGGLGALGLELAWNRIRGGMVGRVLLIGMAVAVLCLNSLMVILMPYELDGDRILESVDQILDKEREAAILVPWAYSDFHFLRIMRPEARIYHVGYPVDDRPLGALGDKWQRRLKGWYGEAYLGSQEELDRILDEGEVYFLGWRKYPPAQNAQRVLGRIGLEQFAERIERLPLADHLVASWVWTHPGIDFEYVGKCGQYEYYRTNKRDGAGE